MAGHALRVIISSILFDRLVRVVTGGATYSAIIRVALAVKYAVRLEPDVVDLHALEQAELIVAPVAGGAKILRQLVAAEPFGIEDQFSVGLFLLCPPPRVPLRGRDRLRTECPESPFPN